MGHLNIYPGKSVVKVELMIYNKTQFIANMVVDGLLIIYLFFLNSYNRYLEGIQSIYDNRIAQAFAIVDDPGFYKVFILGILFLVAMVVFIIWIVKESILPEWRKEHVLIDSIVFTLVDVGLFITLIIMMSNPIFTAFATVLAVGGIFVGVNK